MKTCPNCGSKMEADVNFCTVCGTNIKDVPLDGAQPVEQPAPQAPVNPQSQSQVNAEPQQIQSQVQPSQQPQQINDTFSKVSSQITSAVKNFDKESLWKWFVTSWKTPSAQQQGEKWYGIATLLVEIILFTICFTEGVKRFTMAKVPSEYISEVQSKMNSFFQTMGFDIFLITLITCAGIIAASYFASKFAHGTTVSIFEYVNKVVQMSNIDAVIVIVMSVLLFSDIEGTIKITSPLALFTVLLFLLAAGFCIKDGPLTTRDPFYGVILYLVLVAIVVWLEYIIFKGQIITQIQQIFGVNISQYIG